MVRHDIPRLWISQRFFDRRRNFRQWLKTIMESNISTSAFSILSSLFLFFFFFLFFTEMSVDFPLHIISSFSFSFFFFGLLLEEKILFGSLSYHRNIPKDEKKKKFATKSLFINHSFSVFLEITETILNSHSYFFNY